MTTNELSFNLPQDLLNQILVLLPFDSILDCKLVSKELKNLIDDPEFFKRYRDTSLALLCFNNSVYCLLVREGNITISNIINGDCNPPFTVNRIPFDLEDNGDGIRKFLWEPSNGIACVLTNNSRLLFYNLFTGASYTTTDFPLCKHSEIELICYGFGYDCYDDSCKIMWKHKRKRILDDYDNGLYWVYSLRNKERKSFKGFPYAAYEWSSWLLMYSRQARSFNGVLHWAFPKRRTRTTPEKPVISTYDLHTCMFGEMPLPTDDCNIESAQLVELGGQLCCKLMYYHHLTISVWTMREYGVSESWEMLFSIYNPSWIPRRTMRIGVLPTMLYECPDGRKVVLFFYHWNGSLNWYDVNNGELKHIEKSAWEKIRRTRKEKIRVETMES